MSLYLGSPSTVRGSFIILRREMLLLVLVLPLLHLLDAQDHLRVFL